MSSFEFILRSRYIYLISLAHTVKMSAHPVETILQYQFSNRELLDEALVTEGASKTAENPKGGGQGSRRLALLGDSVLRECILEAWFQTKERVGKCIYLKLATKTHFNRRRVRRSRSLSQ